MAWTMEEKTGGLCPVSECGLLAKTEYILRAVFSSWVDKAGRARKPRSLTRKDWKNGWGGICVFLYLPPALFTGLGVEGVLKPSQIFQLQVRAPDATEEQLKSFILQI